MQEEKKVKKITVEYEDGSKKELTKGVVAEFEGDRIKMDLAYINNIELVRLAYGAALAVNKLGLMDLLQEYATDLSILDDESDGDTCKD